MIADLLTVAARVLDRAGDLPPVTVTCSPSERFLPPVTVTPASLAMADDDQADIARTVASRMGWPLRPLSEGDGWISTGTVDGVEVQAIAAPLSGGTSSEALTRATDVTTAEHAELLRTLVDWSASLPTKVMALEVTEELHGTGRFKARLVLPVGSDVSRVSELVMPVPADGWSGYRGSGVLPTGHALTISVGI